MPCHRSRSPFWVVLLFACLALPHLAGCATVRVRPAEGPTVTSAWRASAITGSDLSPRTRQTVRRFDLENLFPHRLTELSGQLHEHALRDPHPELLFALAEVNYLRGAQAEKKGLSHACVFYYLSAGYAYHYLFDAYRPPVPAQSHEEVVTCASSEVFDPRFRLACDLYNAGLAKCLAAAQKSGQLDIRHCLSLPSLEGNEEITLRVVHSGFRYKPQEFGPVLLCADYQVVGLANHHRTYGLGVPLIGSRDAQVPLSGQAYYPSQVHFPITAFLRFEGNLAELHQRRDGKLELHNPLAVQSLRVGQRTIPLESDLTTPLAYYLAGAGLEAAGYTGFLRPDSLGEKAGLHTLEPYEPGKIPVILVHGLLGTPTTWAPLFNDLQADPVLRKHFQFWVYFYPTSNPYLITASELRHELANLRQALDPDRADPALDDMVLVGHSMGGLVSRLLTIDGGEDFWRLVSPVAFKDLRLHPTTRDELRRTFYFERQPFVTRAIFLGTPHRGSKLSPSLIGRLGAYLAGIPQELRETAHDILEENPELAQSLKPRKITSVDLLAPDAPALQLIAHRPRPASVRYHSVIGITSRRSLLLERLFGGGYCQPSDGVVPYSSAHLEDVDSELIVPANHYQVHRHPRTILEVRRILLEHFKAHQERLYPIQRVSESRQ